MDPDQEPQNKGVYADSTEVTPTSSDMAKTDDDPGASHLQEAGTDVPVNEKSPNQKKTSEQFSSEHQQIKLLMELLDIQDDCINEEERWGDDDSRFPNSVEVEKGTDSSGQWIKTTIVLPHPLGM